MNENYYTRYVNDENGMDRSVRKMFCKIMNDQLRGHVSQTMIVKAPPSLNANTEQLREKEQEEELRWSNVPLPVTNYIKTHNTSNEPHNHAGISSPEEPNGYVTYSRNFNYIEPIIPIASVANFADDYTCDLASQSDDLVIYYAAVAREKLMENNSELKQHHFTEQQKQALIGKLDTFIKKGMELKESKKFVSYPQSVYPPGLVKFSEQVRSMVDMIPLLSDVYPIVNFVTRGALDNVCATFHSLVRGITNFVAGPNKISNAFSLKLQSTTEGVTSKHIVGEVKLVNVNEIHEVSPKDRESLDSSINEVNRGNAAANNRRY